MTKKGMRIIGVDPGSRVTGFGVIEKDGKDLKYIASGCIKPPAKRPFSDRLQCIYNGLLELLDKYKPDTLAIEDVFVAKNVKSALKLGQIRGAVIMAAKNKGLGIAEYPPATVKMALVGFGCAEKKQVAKMVELVLKIGKISSTDESDALAAAICHGHHTTSRPLEQI